MINPYSDPLYPANWAHGILSPKDWPVDFYQGSAVLRDRHSRGVVAWSQLINTGFWRFKKRGELKSLLTNLREEYRDLLQILVETEKLREKIVSAAAGIKPKSGIKPEVVSPTREVDHYAPPYKRDEEVTRPLEIPAGAVIDLDELRKGTSFEALSPSAPETYAGHGGSFGGAGASGSWDSGSSSDSSSSSCDSSSSSDSGSSSDGGSCGSGD